MRSDSWRSSVDHLIMTVATNACKEGWTREKNTSVYADAMPVWADFQLAALRALLTSLLSPGRVRPPHLAQSLDLFRRGKSCKPILFVPCHCLSPLLPVVLMRTRGLEIEIFKV